MTRKEQIEFLESQFEATVEKKSNVVLAAYFDSNNYAWTR